MNAPDLEVEVGGFSPGPAEYTGNWFSAHYEPPRFSMAKKTKYLAGGELAASEKRPSPAAYSLDSAIGKQGSARKPSRPIFSFGKAPRFPGAKREAEEREARKSGKMPGGDATGVLRLKFQRSKSLKFNVLVIGICCLFVFELVVRSSPSKPKKTNSLHPILDLLVNYLPSPRFLHPPLLEDGYCSPRFLHPSLLEDGYWYS